MGGKNTSHLTHTINFSEQRSLSKGARGFVRRRSYPLIQFSAKGERLECALDPTLLQGENILLDRLWIWFNVEIPKFFLFGWFLNLIWCQVKQSGEILWVCPQTPSFHCWLSSKSKACINKPVCPTLRRLLCRANARFPDLWEWTSSGKDLLGYTQAAPGRNGGDKGGARSPTRSVWRLRAQTGPDKIKLGYSLVGSMGVKVSLQIHRVPFTLLL